MASLLDAQKIANYALQDSRYPEIELAQVAHRIRLISAWKIQSGSRLLEIGCGQGNCTTVLSEIVGPDGHIDAVDPAPSDYGAPFTLAQAQAHITASEIGSRITWHEADPLEFLKSTEISWDAVVFSHCIWYFSSPMVLRDMLSKLQSRVKRVLIAEYALSANSNAALPHVYAALARGALEAHKDQSTENIRCPLSPSSMKDLLREQNWTLDSEEIITPDKGLSDGRWEVLSVKHKSFQEEIVKHIKDDRVNVLLKSMQDATIAAASKIASSELQTMDVWVATASVVSP